MSTRKTGVLFSKYLMTGVLNTLIHWGVFFLAYSVFNASQALGNFIAFCVAVSFSFFANARFTFKSNASVKRYLLFVSFMGTLSALIGWGADALGALPIITLVFFSAVSLVLGFVYSRYIVFRT
ncbi:GtrA family protein [Advenella sp. RU8]|uniref:GtrA family protein n=1 Tax=Advenella sp. RU8 TaxID=3399575 RepID=UPI003AAE35B2